MDVTLGGFEQRHSTLAGIFFILEKSENSPSSLSLEIDPQSVSQVWTMRAGGEG